MEPLTDYTPVPVSPQFWKNYKIDPEKSVVHGGGGGSYYYDDFWASQLIEE